MLHAVTHFFQRVQLHVFALTATAVVAGQLHHVEDGCADEFLARTFLLHPMDDARFGHDHESLRRVVAAIGASCGFGLYAIATYVTLLTLFIFEALWYFEERFVRIADKAPEEEMLPTKKPIQRHETES